MSIDSTPVKIGKLVSVVTIVIVFVCRTSNQLFRRLEGKSASSRGLGVLEPVAYTSHDADNKMGVTLG
jgi:hypothetical protein